jgi:hypothetical protein
MGTLDDAIREHLELKKRLGASDDEIQEKEGQAFGKGARSAPPEPEAPQEPQQPEPAGEGESFVEHDLPAAEPAPNGQPREGAWEPADFSRTEPTVDEIFEPDEVPAEEALDPGLTVRDQRVAREQDTGEHRSDSWSEEPAEPAAEDVLEETPEFLEETPEHDRLWFEQRPPKDFDFD